MPLDVERVNAGARSSRREAVGPPAPPPCVTSGQLDATAARLRAPGTAGNAAAEDRVLASVITLRAYHSGSATARPSRRRADYSGLHATLRATIADWFQRNASTLSRTPPTSCASISR